MSCRSRARLVLAGSVALALRAAGAPMRDPAACDAAVRARPSDSESWRCYEIVGQTPAYAQDVARRLERAMAARPADPFPRLALGLSKAGRGAESAVAHLSEAIAGFRRLADDADEAQALVSLMRFHAYKGRRDAARAAFEELRALAARSTSSEPALLALAAEASVAQIGGDYGKAWTLLKETDPRLLTEASPFARRSALLSLAYAAWATGRPAESVSAYRKVIASLRDEGDRFREAQVGASLLSVLTTPGISTPEERRRVAEETVDAARESGNLAAEATALDYLADFEGPGPASETKVSRALELARESKDPSALAMALRAQCLYGSSADRESAYREALAAVESAANPNERARLFVVRSRMLWMSGPRDEAIRASTAAMDAAESTRDLQPDNLTRARRFGQWGRPYKELAGHLLAGDLLPPGSRPSQDDVALAFEALERMRARVLLDELRAAGVTLSGTDVPDRTAFPTLAGIRSGLAPDEALLAYVITDVSPSDGPTWGERSYVFAVSRDAVAVRPILEARAGSESIALFTGLVDARRGDDAAGATRFYADYVKAALETLPPGVRRLVLVPDRILFPLPFAALRPAPAVPTLGETYDLSVAPSVTIWWKERSRPAATAPRGVLAFVDPGAGAGSPQTPERAVAASLPPLALAPREGASAVRRVGRHSLVLSGSEAVEAVLRSTQPAEFRVLHFAAHALLDDAHPDRSAIVLAPDRANDGLLHSREIATLKLPGSLVVVSGCRSAGGLLVEGEGPIGLARAFFRAGARVVVGSLRPLRDDEAAAFFDRFYAHLADGASVAGAVRLAQRDRRRAGAPTAAWAGIVALGDGGAVPFPGGTGGRWPMYLGLGIGAALAVSLAFWVRGSRRP